MSCAVCPMAVHCLSLHPGVAHSHSAHHHHVLKHGMKPHQGMHMQSGSQRADLHDKNRDNKRQGSSWIHLVSKLCSEVVQLHLHQCSLCFLVQWLQAHTQRLSSCQDGLLSILQGNRHVVPLCCHTRRTKCMQLTPEALVSQECTFVCARQLCAA